MKMFILLLSLLAFTARADDYQLRVVVLDTGLDLKDERFQGVLCKTGHTDTTGYGIKDNNGHGTHVAGIIKQYAKDSNYCLVIVKYYDERQDVRSRTVAYIDALANLYDKPIDIINLSGGGNRPLLIEEGLINLHQGITFVVAAGNDNENMDKDCRFYPACYGDTYKNIIVVGSKCNTFKSRFSNYGSYINQWECGENVISTGIEKDAIMSGTSQATAIATGKLIYKLTHSKK